MRSATRRRSTIDRPRRAASNEGRSRLGDLTRPIARENAITRRWSSTAVFAVVAGTIALALAVTLFVLPVRTWLQQSDELDTRQAQLDELESINDDLQAEVDRLQTPAGAEEAIRQEIGMVPPGQKQLTMLDEPMLPAKLPRGWPYSAVTDIFAVLRSRPAADSPHNG